MASVFLGINRNKRAVAIDLKSPEGAEVLRRLIPTVDVLVTNIRPAGMARLGFGPEQCRALNPKLVFAVATGFGQDGPHRARPAFDEIIQAASGFADIVGEEQGQPMFVPSLVADKITGMALLSAVLAALYHRERTGEGQLVEVPMLETLTAFLSVEHLGGLAFEPPQRRARLQAAEAPQAGADQGWPHHPAALFLGELESLLHHGRPARPGGDAVGRGPGEAQRPYRQGLCGDGRDHPGSTTAEWLALGEEHDIPATGFSRIEDVPEHPHLKAVGMFEPARPPDRGPHPPGQAADEIRQDPRQYPQPAAAARRAYRRGPGRTRLPGGGDRRHAGPEGDPPAVSLPLSPRIRATAAPAIPTARGWAARYAGAAGPLIDLTQAVPGYPPHPDLLAKLANWPAAAPPPAMARSTATCRCARRWPTTWPASTAPRSAPPISPSPPAATLPSRW